MSSFKRYQSRMKVLGTTESERALTEGVINYNYYLKNAGNRLELPMTKVGEFYITDKTQIVPCTMRDVKFNDQKNFDQKVITVSADSNVDVGSYVMWDARTYLVIYEQHKEIPTHKTYVIRFCNSSFHCFDNDGEVVEIPMSSHDLTLYSNGLRNGKYLDYENDKRKVLIPNNELTNKNIKVGQRVFFSKFNTFKITSIDDFSMTGLFAMMFEQTLNTPEDDALDQITQQQKNEQQAIINARPPEFNPLAPIESNVITGDNIKVGMSGVFELTNTDLTEVNWSTNIRTKQITLEQKGLTCTVLTETNGKLVGKTFNVIASSKGETIATKEVTIESLF